MTFRKKWVMEIVQSELKCVCLISGHEWRQGSMKEDEKRLIGKYTKMSRGAYIAATLLDSKKKEEPSGPYWKKKQKAFWEEKSKAFWEK
jgi:hypothetical protein